MIAQPTGTVTLLFTDIEGSTKLLERLGADAYTGVLQLHRRLLLQAFEGHAGYPVDEEGDALFVAFARAEDAVAAAADGQLALAGASWPAGVEVRVRVGIHSGEPLAVPPNYVGMDVHRAARIMAAGHGGQVLVSERRGRCSTASSSSIWVRTGSRTCSSRSTSTSSSSTASRASSRR